MVKNLVFRWPKPLIVLWVLLGTSWISTGSTGSTWLVAQDDLAASETGASNLRPGGCTVFKDFFILSNTYKQYLNNEIK